MRLEVDGKEVDADARGNPRSNPAPIRTTITTMRCPTPPPAGTRPPRRFASSKPALNRAARSSSRCRGGFQTRPYDRRPSFRRPFLGEVQPRKRAEPLDRPAVVEPAPPRPRRRTTRASAAAPRSRSPGAKMGRRPLRSEQGTHNPLVPCASRSRRGVRPEYGGRFRRNDHRGARRSLLIGRTPGETLSFLRKQESRNPGRRRIPGKWIPVFAGMTIPGGAALRGRQRPGGHDSVVPAGRS